MKLKNLLFVFCLALLAGCQKDPDTESAPARDTDRVEGVIRMKLDRETAEALNVTRTRSGRVLTGNISFDELCKRYEVTGMERLFADNGCAERTRKAGLDLWYVIRFKGSAEQVAEDFGEIAGVNHVEIPRKITKVGDVGRRSGTPWRKLMALPKAVPANYPFNDPLFAEQWPLYNDGSVSEEAVAGADINVIPAWKKTAGRSDVIVAVLDVSGNAGQCNYSASKAGMIGLAKSIAKEMGPRGIRANAIAPGFIITEMTNALPEEVKQGWYQQIPLRRGGTPEDVAKVALFLASDLSSYVSGQVIHCCGAMNC